MKHKKLIRDYLYKAESRMAGVRVEEDVFLFAILYLLILEHRHLKNSV